MTENHTLVLPIIVFMGCYSQNKAVPGEILLWIKIWRPIWLYKVCTNQNFRLPEQPPMYHRVIVAVDFSDTAQLVVDRAAELAGQNRDILELVHVVEPIPKVWGMESYALDPDELQEKIEAKGLEKLNRIGTTNNISRRHLVTGDPASSIRSLQEKIQADAIVIGSHGHSGWKIMLGSTAVSLLHGATCDVLTVYVGTGSNH